MSGLWTLKSDFRNRFIVFLANSPTQRDNESGLAVEYRGLIFFMDAEHNRGYMFMTYGDILVLYITRIYFFGGNPIELDRLYIVMARSGIYETLRQISTYLTVQHTCSNTRIWESAGIRKRSIHCL